MGSPFFLSPLFWYRSYHDSTEKALEMASTLLFYFGLTVDMRARGLYPIAAKDRGGTHCSVKGLIIAGRSVSGGGIFAWSLGSELSEDWSVSELVGIFHTYDRSKGLIIGTPLWVLAMAVQLGQMKDFGGVR